MQVKRISTSDTYALRLEYLRPHGGVESVKFTGDRNEQTFHLGAFMGNKLVSVSSFYFDRSDHFQETNQYRLRGMATHPMYRGQGLSRTLLQTAFPIIKQNFCKLVWCNARVSALPFYEKVGFKKIGQVFDIEDVGPHQVVYLNLE